MKFSIATTLPPKVPYDMSGHPENTIVGQPSNQIRTVAPFVIRGKSIGFIKVSTAMSYCDGIMVAIGVPSLIVSPIPA
ncbi:hypothetical protein D3C85_1108930 [compost metagenome]